MKLPFLVISIIFAFPVIVYSEVYNFYVQCRPDNKGITTVLMDKTFDNCKRHVSCKFYGEKELHSYISYSCGDSDGYHNFGNPLPDFKSNNLTAYFSNDKVFITTLDFDPKSKTIQSRLFSSPLMKSANTEHMKISNGLLIFEESMSQTKLYTYKKTKCSKESFKLKFVDGCFRKDEIDFSRMK